ncbi:MAG: hypothetical protein ACREOO_10440 [bacterium]
MITAISRLRNTLLKFILSLALALGGACESRLQKARPLETAKFAQVYVGLLQVTVGDSLPPSKADSVFQAHGITRQNFEAASQYFNAEAERWVEVLKLVVAQLDSQLAMETQKPSKDSNKQ